MMNVKQNRRYSASTATEFVFHVTVLILKVPGYENSLAAAEKFP